MTALSYLVIIFGYLALLIFIFGIIYRAWRWNRLPQGFSWGLFPKPTRWVVTSMLWKILAWPTLFKADRLLWVGAFFFHLGLLVLFVGHLGSFIDIAALGEGIGIPKESSYGIGITAGAIVAVAILFYISRRLFIRRSSEISVFADHFWLWVELVLVLGRVSASMFDSADCVEAGQSGQRGLAFIPAHPQPGFWFLAHVLLSEFFIIYAVIGKPIHLIGQLFTQYILVSEEGS